MANREELLVIRAARSGQASAQLALGKRYLFGGAGLPKSEATALYWLDRAAHQEEAEAWLLIGSHIPFEAASRAPQPAQLCVWYERAFDSGVMQAGLVLARLVLAQTEHGTSDALRRKAWMALEAVAHAGIGEAQWLMAQLIGQSNSCETGLVNRETPRPVGHAFLMPIMKLPIAGRAEQAILDWTIRAAGGGVRHAQHALADHAWSAGNHTGYLQWALPLARQAIALRGRRVTGLGAAAGDASSGDICLFARCARILFERGHFDSIELERFLDAAASGGDLASCLSLGLWYARMDPDGSRLAGARGLANYRKALRWLTFAGEQGLAAAWYATSRIYLKPEFSQRNLSDARYYVQKAAESGHPDAQFELGVTAWRARRTDPRSDIDAAYWLCKAAAQNHPEALRLIDKVVDPSACTKWTREFTRNLVQDHANACPMLASRLELAAEFGLTRAEALLLKITVADCGHCLVIDIRDVHPRSKRRLALIKTSQQRHLLNRIVRQFEDIDCSAEGPEGNYRQRLYRLRMLGKRQ